MKFATYSAASDADATAVTFTRNTSVSSVKKCRCPLTPVLTGSALSVYVLFPPLLPAAAYVKRYPLFAPLASEASIKHADAAAGIAGGVQLAGVPPSPSDAKFAANPTV